MKRKYFVRGLGVGILFGALIMFAAYMTSGKNRMSDEDVIKRAQELGMVKQSEYVLEIRKLGVSTLSFFFGICN